MSTDTMVMRAIATDEPQASDAEVAFFRRVEPSQLIRWQSVWVSLVDQAWATLAVVPVGQWTLASDVVGRLVDAAQSMRQGAFSSPATPAQREIPGRALLPLASPLHAPAAALAARNTDAVLLVLSLGRDTLEQARAVRDLIGARRFLGCLVVNEKRVGR